MTRKEIRIDGTKTGRTFTRQIEGKGKRRRIVYRVGRNHSPEFLRKHPKGSIWTSVPVREGTRKAGARFAKVNKERPILLRVPKKQTQRLSTPIRPVSQTPLKNVVVARYRGVRPPFRAIVEIEWIFSVERIVKGKSKFMDIMIVGRSSYSSKRIDRISEREHKKLIEQSENQARAELINKEGIRQGSDRDIVIATPNGEIQYIVFDTIKK